MFKDVAVQNLEVNGNTTSTGILNVNGAFKASNLLHSLTQISLVSTGANATYT